VIGYEHTVALTLDELSGQGCGRFRTELLTKAHALINDELPTKGLKNLAELKKIIAGEAITIEAKGATPKTVKVKTKMLFAGNQLPDLAEADCGNAFASRLCVVAFKKAPEETDRDVNLIGDLYQERNAIFSLAIKAFIELRKRSPSLTFWEDKAADAIVKAYMDDNASVITFIYDEKVVTTGDGVSLTELFSYYKDYCIKQALTPVKSIKAFRQQLVSWPQFSGFNKRRLRGNTNPCSVVEGIKLVRGNL
jgi:phage/plasmid-associated DNA primase